MRFKAGDVVRVANKRHPFHRGYSEVNSEEYFVIVSGNNQLPGEPRYIIKDSSDEIIKGNFFEDEIVKYHLNTDFFDINVLDERIRNKVKEYYISYVGYPKKFNEWVRAEKFKKIV